MSEIETPLKTHTPQSSIDIIYKLNRQGELIYVNPVMLDFMETNETDLLHKYFADYIRPDRKQAVVDFYAKQVEQKVSSTHLEVPIINTSGKELWVAQTCQLLYDTEQNISEILVVARDITDQENVKQEARINEEKYQNIIENINLGLMEVDLEEKIIYVNNSFCEIVGYNADELIGKNAKEIFVVSEDTDTQKKVDEVRDERKKDESSAYELKIKRKDGKDVWVIISGAPVKDRAGRIIGSLGIHNDITERKMQELELQRILVDVEQGNDRLKQQQQYLKSINEFSAALIDTNSVKEIVDEILKNIAVKFGFEDCVIYLINPENNELEQYAAYGKKLQDGKIFKPIHVKVGEGIVGSVAQSGKAEIVNDTTLDSRYIVDLEMALSELSVPIVSGNDIIGVIDSENAQKNSYTQQDLETFSTIASLAANKIKNAIVSEQREKAEFALRENETKLRAIINSALDAVITINGEGRVTEWNSQAENLFGFTKEEIVGELLSDKIIPKEHRTGHTNGMRKFHETGEGPVLNNRIEITGLNKNQEVFPIELSIVPIKTDNQYFFSAFVRDITLRKKLEEDMRIALEKEKELRNMKSRFVSMTSHEFRTPLTTIQSNVELLSFHVKRTDLSEHPKVQRNFSRISSEIKRLNALMNDILMIGRLESGKMPFRPEEIDLQALCVEIIDQKTNDLEVGRKIKISVKGNIKKTWLDGNLYEHIINNLISNALKYSPANKDPEIELEYRDKEVIIKVIDKGIGIPKKDQQKLFESFFRAENVGNIQGTGLGLTIVKQFVEMHQGKIEVSSKANAGTTFYIHQPLKLKVEPEQSINGSI